MILGANGAIGSALTHYLLSQGQTIHAVVRSVDRIHRLYSVQDDLTLHINDSRSSVDLTSLLVRHDIHAIVNCAFPSGHISDLADMHLKILEANQAMFSLVEAMQLSKFSGELVHLGSALSYGDGPAPRAVTQALNPIVMRGACKAAESVLLRQLVRQLPVNFTELRVFTSFGPFEQTDRFVPQLLRAALKRTKISLTKTPRWRDWLYNADIAEAVLRVVQQTAVRKCHDSDDNGGAVINLCTGTLHSTHEVAALSEAIVGYSLVANQDYPEEERYGKPAIGVLPDVRNEFNWQPAHNISRGLEKSWQWAQSDVGRTYLLNDAISLPDSLSNKHCHHEIS